MFNSSHWKSEDSNGGYTWTSAEAQWDVQRALAHRTLPAQDQDRIARVRDVVVAIAQGINPGRIIADPDDDGAVPARLIGSTDIYPLTPGRGEAIHVSQTLKARRTVHPGDVLIPRMAVKAAACIVPESHEIWIPKADVMVLRPMDPVHGANLAAALCTDYFASKMNRLASGAAQRLWSKSRIGQAPLPAASYEEQNAVYRMVNEVKRLVGRGEDLMGGVSNHIDQRLETAPSTTSMPKSYWMKALELPEGWGWRDFRLFWLLRNPKKQQGRFGRLGELPGIRMSRARTKPGETDRTRVLHSDEFRTTWHQVIPSQDSEQPPDRFYVPITQEAVLAPFVGAVDAPPVVVGREVLGRSGGAVLGPQHWMPITGFRFPRALAVLLDHPFMRAQRQLSAASSTVPHLTVEDVRSLMLPSFTESEWVWMEDQMIEAHKCFEQATAIGRDAIERVNASYLATTEED